MTCSSLRRRTAVSILVSLSVFTTVDRAAGAQKKDYQPGEAIEYRAETYPKEVWTRGVFVRLSDAGSYCIIRMKPSAAFKDGYEKGAECSTIRPISGTAPAARALTPAGVPENRVGPVPPKSERTEITDAGPMSQEDVLTFLRTNLGERQFENPRRDEIKNALVELIRRRGLDFRYSVSLVDFRRKLSAIGTSSEIMFALRDNYGAPAQQDWLMGKWTLGKIGGAVDYVADNRLYRQGESGVANVGSLTLNQDRTFEWKSVSAQPTRGAWRVATDAEMKSEGGAGVVLLRAKSGYDWIVTKDRRNPNKGEWIFVAELGTRQVKEYGSRG